ncbi:unnamed protein product, partial [Rotaria sp. Silwood1]
MFPQPGMPQQVPPPPGMPPNAFCFETGGGMAQGFGA